MGRGYKQQFWQMKWQIIQSFPVFEQNIKMSELALKIMQIYKTRIIHSLTPVRQREIYNFYIRPIKTEFI